MIETGTRQNKPLFSMPKSARRCARLALAGGLAVMIGWGVTANPVHAAPEIPMLRPAVQSGDLPPMAERLPKTPLKLDFETTGRSIGRHGGEIDILMGRAKDIRMVTVYGYARLVGYDRNLMLKPDILETVDVRESRIFTLTLREGHKWSDGHPFTAEDFRYFWEDVALNENLKRGGPPTDMMPGGQAPTFEIIDERTVRYTWPVPNPLFLSALAGARPLEIMMPAHYLRQYHEKYADADTLAAMVEDASVKDWASLHTRMARSYRPENPALPTLQPWRNTTKPPSERFVFERNPFYHRVDPEGQQLPYIDRVIISTGSSSLIAAKTGTGDADLQARYLRFDDYTFLKAAEKQHDFDVRLWEVGKGSQIALIPNLNYEDDVWRTLFQDNRFRRALSVAINRREINNAIYYGLARESANTVLPRSPLFKPEYAAAWSQYDVDLANQLLDEMGLTEKDFDGIRRLPDGRRAEIIIASAGESTEYSDVLELIGDAWRKVGIKLFPRASQREVFRRRIFAGQTMMSIWSGYDNGLATADFAPKEYAPTEQDQYQWPAWGLYGQTLGESGEEPTLATVKELKSLYDRWMLADSTKQKSDIWHRILEIHAEEVFTIGIVNGARQPVVVSNKLKNVPDEGIWTYAPSAYYGIYQPDSFWLDNEATRTDPS
jgi:peptide/nickel transport system substrate-binding protein